MNDLEMPPQLAARPQYQGVPVPYVTVWGKEGLPVFAESDVSRKRRCIENRLCTLCGRQLAEEIAFVGNASQLETRLFPEPGMHEDCARFGLRTCPFLLQHSPMFLCITTDYIRHPIESELVVKISEPVRTERFDG